MTTLRSSPPADGEQSLFSQARFPDLYEQDLVGPLFQPWVEPLLDEVKLRPGDRVLDLACGTGIVARLARERLPSTGTVVGVDLNPHMLAVARRLAPSIDWREGDAAALPLQPGERFDVVLCQQGFQFFPDRAAAARQAHQALVPHGRLAVSTWCPDDEFPVLRVLRNIAEKRLGPIHDRRHALGDPEPLQHALREAGFHDIRSKRCTRTICFTDGFLFVRLNAMALVSMSAASATLGDNEREQLVTTITDDSAEIVQQHTRQQGFLYELGTHITLARA